MQPVKVKPIRSEADYQAALAQIEKIFGAAPDSPAGQMLDILTVLVEDWERRQNYEIPSPDPISAIKFRMEQKGLTQRDLIPYIGSLSKVSEVLSGKRNLSISMIRALNKGLNIPAEVLLNEPLPEIPTELEAICQQLDYLPLNVMKKRGWFDSLPCTDIKHHAEETFRSWVSLLGGTPLPIGAFPRATRQTENTDKYALFVWCIKVLLEAKKVTVPIKYKNGCIDFNFLRELRKLSLLTDGPKQAIERLKEKGIRVIKEDHLPKTHLDGALLNLNGEPVIGLTLRYDRIDYFWFTFFHELAHLIHDFDKDSTVIFTDDMTLDSTASALDESEKRADETARDALIPKDEWESEIQKGILPSSSKIIQLAFKWQVNPAIIAGRLRYETKNYRIYPDFVGTGEIKPLFNKTGG